MIRPDPLTQVGPLIQQLKQACRRPLYTEICLDLDKLDYKALLLEKAGLKVTTTKGPRRPESVELPLPAETASSSSAQPPVSSSTSFEQAKKEEKSWREVSKNCMSCPYCQPTTVFIITN